MKKILLIITLLLSNFAFAESWNLFNNVSITPPENPDITFQSLEGLGDEEYLAGWKGDSLSYFFFVSGEKINASKKNVWDSFIKDLKRQADKPEVEVVSEYNYSSGIESKILHYFLDGEETYQLIAIHIKDGFVYYFVGTTIDGDYEYMEASLYEVLSNININ